MSVAVEVVEVVRARPDERLWGGHLEAPQAGEGSGDGAVELIGWVLGRSAPAVRVDLQGGDVVVGSAKVNVRRPDLADAFPDVPEGAGGGFRARLQLLGDAAGAMEVWKQVLDEHNYARARVQLAELYIAEKKRDLASLELQTAINDDRHAPAFQRKRDRVWIRRARALLR